MRTTARVLFSSLIALGTTEVSAQAAGQAVNDLFNRTAGTQLGLDWTEVNGDAQISGNRIVGNSPFDLGWSAHTTFDASWSQTAARMTWAMNGGGGDRVSIICGADTSTWSAVEVRIGDNDGDGSADRVWWNAAVNAGAWFSGASFANLTTPLASGEATVWFTNGGNTVNLELRDSAGANPQTYSASGILAMPPTGTRVGFGYYNNPFVDDFQAWTGNANGLACTLTRARTNQSASLLVTHASPNAPVLVAFSTIGGGPIPTAIGNVLLSEPVVLLGAFPAAATGRVEVPMGTVPPGLSGAVFWVQAFDATANVLSNGFSMAVL